MALPILTPEARAAALEKAGRARKERSEVKHCIKRGTVTVPDALKRGTTDDLTSSPP
jgi:hypothetical protein